MALALATLDTFRPSVGAAACGLASRAFDEAVRHVAGPRGSSASALAEFQATQLALAEMHVELEGARLLVRHAAWTEGPGDGAHHAGGGRGQARGHGDGPAGRGPRGPDPRRGGRDARIDTVERLYREVRALRIYEGTSEIQKLVIAGAMLKEKR